MGDDKKTRRTLLQSIGGSAVGGTLLTKSFQPVSAQSGENLEVPNIIFIQDKPKDYREFTRQPDQEYKPDSRLWYYYEVNGVDYKQTERGIQTDIEITEWLYKDNNSSPLAERTAQVNNNRDENFDMSSFYRWGSWKIDSQVDTGTYHVAISVNDNLAEATTKETGTFYITESDFNATPLLAALGITVGGGSLWWFRRVLDGDGDNGQSADGSVSKKKAVNDDNDGSDSLSKSDVNPPEDDGFINGIRELIERANNNQDAAKILRETDDYDTALEAYSKALTLYEEAFEKAKQDDLIDTNKINQDLTTIQNERQEVYRQQLDNEIESIRSNLDQIEENLTDGKLGEAQDRLENLETTLKSPKETAVQHGFEDIREELNSLEQRRKALLKDVTEQIESFPIPENIPSLVELSVEYKKLINKEPIGGGGNADVTKATLPTPDGDVTLAIKEPRMSGTLHTKAIEQMLKEAETWDKLDDHQHIVAVVDYGSTPVPWIAMEYMDAGHLGDRSGKLDIPQALWTAIGVTKGVRHAHRRGVAHLDLKPKNVLFRSVENSWDVPKVADWGLSKHLLEHSKSVEGLSPQYAAPEQFDDEYGPADDITDIYQLGAVFYELFTGEPPFDGKPAKAMHKVLHEEPTAPSEVADVPEKLDNILLTALAKEKTDRYDNIVYLRDELQELFDNQ